MEGGQNGMHAGQDEEINDGGFQVYQTAYVDPARAQATSFMPEFAGMDPASQAAALQQHCAQIPQVGEQVQQQSETESDLEEGVDAAQHRLTIATVDAQANKGDEAWTEEEEQELMNLVNDTAYRKERLGETSTKWAPIAQAFSRTVKAVKRKYDKLANPDKEQRRSRRLSGSAPMPSNSGDAGMAAHDPLAGMYMGMDTNGMQHYQQQMTEEQAVAAAAAMQAGSAGMSAEQMAAYMEAYGQWQGYGEGVVGEADQSQQLDPLLQHLAAQTYQPPSGASGAGSLACPRNDRVFWKPEEQQELLRIVQDVVYRQQVLGTPEVNWDLVAKHLGRGKRSVQRKYDNLKGAMAGGDAMELPANDGKKWSADEVAELVKLVEEPAYLSEVLSLEKVDWRVLGQHFGRSYESVSYKYSYVKNTGRTGGEGKPKHAKAKHETSYKEMAIWALQQIGGEGTSGQICNVIATNPAYAPQLDTAIVSGKKTLQRWKHGVRSALNAFPMFKKTPRIFEGEVVWHLVEEAVQQEVTAQMEKAARQRNKPLSGAQRRKLKRAQEAGGEGEGEEEEGAQQALAQMAQQRPKKRGRGGGGGGADAGEAAGGAGGRLTLDDEGNMAASAAGAAVAAGMPAAAHAHMEMLAQGQMTLMQHLYDPNAAAITAEQLSMLQPEQLAMLQPEQLAMLHQQMQQGQLGQPALAVTEDGGAVGQPVDGSEQQQQQGGEQQQQYGPSHHYDATHQAQYQAAYEQQQQQQAVYEGQYNQHDPATAAALAAHQQQLVEHYASTGMMDPAAAAAAAQQHMASAGLAIPGVQLGQPVGQAGLELSALGHQSVQGYDQYAQYYQQQYQQYQYDTQYATAGVDPSQYDQPADQQQYGGQGVDPSQYGQAAAQYGGQAVDASHYAAQPADYAAQPADQQQYGPDGAAHYAAQGVDPSQYVQGADSAQYAAADDQQAQYVQYQQQYQQQYLPPPAQ